MVGNKVSVEFKVHTTYQTIFTHISHQQSPVRPSADLRAGGVVSWVFYVLWINSHNNVKSVPLVVSPATHQHRLFDLLTLLAGTLHTCVQVHATFSTYLLKFGS